MCVSVCGGCVSGCVFLCVCVCLSVWCGRFGEGPPRSPTVALLFCSLWCGSSVARPCSRGHVSPQLCPLWCGGVCWCPGPAILLFSACSELWGSLIPGNGGKLLLGPCPLPRLPWAHSHPCWRPWAVTLLGTLCGCKVCGSCKQVSQDPQLGNSAWCWLRGRQEEETADCAPPSVLDCSAALCHQVADFTGF